MKAVQESSSNHRPMFANQDDMKEKVWEALKKPEYNVADFYHKTGLWRTVATNQIFENLTLGVISFNALWIAIDTDNNPAPTLIEAQPLFQVVEHGFCWYFSFEWWVRFSSFKRKRDGLKDGWFVFDSCLVFMMVAETWVMTFFLLCLGNGGGGGAMGNASILRLFRLLRLSRLARMLRSMPELMILIKGMMAASRSVFFTMCLLIIFLYLFAIMLRLLTEGTPVGHMYFHSVPASMGKLLIEGVFLDNLGTTTEVIGDSGWLYVIVFYVFLCISALMVMNMLIGVLCEVVSAVAATEKEKMNVMALKAKLTEVMVKLDKNQSGTLSEEEFVQIVADTQCITLLKEVGVDPIELIDMSPTIFLKQEEGEDWGGEDDVAMTPQEAKEIDFQEFMNLVLELHGTSSSPASVKDLREMKNELVAEIEKMKLSLPTSTADRSTIRRATTKRAGTRNSTDAESRAGARNSTDGESAMMWEVSTTPNRLNVPGVKPLRAAALEVEDLSEVQGEGDGAGNPDLREVERVLETLQSALGKVRRPIAPGAAAGVAESEVADWAESMGRTAEAELQKLRRIQTQQKA